jgi:molybdopterin synthase catalytic subunit
MTGPQARANTMQRSLLLTRDPLDEPALRAGRIPSPTAGAALTFLGIVRGREGEAPITGIDYEAFEAMAEHQFRKLFDELERRWPAVESVHLVHRLGIVPVAEPSLWVEITSPHRGESFAACQWLIDAMKEVVPIWKRPIPSMP